MTVKNHSAFWLLVGCVLAVWSNAANASAAARDAMTQAREEMVDEVIVGGGITNPRVIEAMRVTPRHEFVPASQRRNAHFDMALPIGEGQTISPPYVVAYMTELLDPKPTDKVLEIGTGSGYQAAVLGALVDDVYSIEIVEVLGRRAAQALRRLKYENVHTRIGDGYLGWPEAAPFDSIIVTCSPEEVPKPLVDQLKEGGRMVIPVGQRYEQTIYLMTKKDGKLETEALRPTLFVPMTGEAEERRQVLPDPENPTINNGGFEELGKPPADQPDAKQAPAGWHYQRQLELVTEEAPDGKNYVTLSNSEPGRPAQALQGFAVDGRKVKILEVTMTVRGREIRPGQSVEEQAYVAITYYDQRRGTIGNQAIGPWRGSFPWQTVVRRVEVPAKAREAIIQISLGGAVGEIAFDAISIRAVQ